MSAAVKLGLSNAELVEIDTYLRRMAEVLAFFEKFHSTGLADLTERIVSLQQTIAGLEMLKQQFAPMGTGGLG